MQFNNGDQGWVDNDHNYKQPPVATLSNSEILKIKIQNHKFTLNLITNGTQVNRAIIFNFSSNNIPAGIFLNIR